ncbi:MAG: amidohydrolase family protein, partial [Caulobacteraceae bacterium]
FGLSRRGLFPEMLARGVNVALGSDGLTAPILESGRLLAGLFRDAREDEGLFGAAQILEMTTCNGAKALRLEDEIGSLAVGKKADIVLHDADLLQWGPLFDPALQIAFSASAMGVHSVFVDGVQVIEDGRSTLVDEAELIAEGRRAGAAVIERTGLPGQPTWPIL